MPRATMATTATTTSSSRTSQVLVPQAKAGLDRLKFEVASEVGVTLNPGYNGNIAAKDAGKIGGNMVKRLISQAEQSMAGTNNNYMTF